MEAISGTQLLDQMKVMITKAQQSSNPAQAVQSSPNQQIESSFKDVLHEVNETQMQAGKLQERFTVGDPNVSLAQVMLANQKASISFQATLQVRNKLMQAYRSIMEMPI